MNTILVETNVINITGKIMKLHSTRMHLTSSPLLIANVLTTVLASTLSPHSSFRAREPVLGSNRATVNYIVSYILICKFCVDVGVGKTKVFELHGKEAFP
jgi:flagellar basal body rod protein FlgC